MINDIQLLRALYERLPDLLPGFNPHDPDTAPDLNHLPTLQRIVVGALEHLADDADSERAQLSALYMLGCLKGMRHVARRLVDLADSTSSEPIKASALYVAARGLDLLRMSPFSLRPPGAQQAGGGGLNLNPSVPLPSVPSPAAAAARPPLPRAPIPPKPRTAKPTPQPTPPHPQAETAHPQTLQPVRSVPFYPHPQAETAHPQAEEAEPPAPQDNFLPPAGGDVAQRQRGAPAHPPTDPQPTPPAEPPPARRLRPIFTLSPPNRHPPRRRHRF